VVALELRRAAPADLPFIRETERLPGYESVVGRWDEALHRERLADPHYAYFVGFDHGDPAGFAILRDWASAERVTLLKRVAVTRPGAGLGRALLAGLLDRVFGETEAWRLWLGVFPENLRAQRAYAAVGFRPEGVARGSAFFHGRFHDELVMAILRPEWQARQQSKGARPW